jgi:hypothetical protein
MAIRTDDYTSTTHIDSSGTLAGGAGRSFPAPAVPSNAPPVAPATSTPTRPTITTVTQQAPAGIPTTATGTKSAAMAAEAAGDICWDSDAIYVCVSTNSWKKAAIAAW